MLRTTKQSTKSITKKQPKSKLKSTSLHKTKKSTSLHKSTLHHTSTRSFAINLVNSKSTPINTTTNNSTSPISTDQQSITDDNDTTPKTFTTNDFVVLPSAIKRLKTLNKNSTSIDTQVGLRITVDTGGCSGFQYIYNTEQAPNRDTFSLLDDAIEQTKQQPDLPQQLLINNEDLYFIKDSQFVVTDDISMDFLKNSQLDYKTELIRSGFAIVNNPNVDLACGCGTSFSKKAGKNDV